MKALLRLITARSTKSRIAFGQVSIFISVALVAVIIGIVPDYQAIKLKDRVALAEAIAANGSVLVTRSDLLRLEAVLTLVVQRNEDIISAGIRRDNQQLVVSVADHPLQWQMNLTETDRQMSVPIYSDRKQWGSMELRFTPLYGSGLWGFYQRPVVQFLLFTSIILYLLYYFYLGRMLKQLDPSQAVPDRVRTALDTMAEGLLVLDRKSQIVLANKAFSDLLNMSSPSLMGYEVSRLPWRHKEDEEFSEDFFPWQKALHTGQAEMNSTVRLELDEGVRTFMVNCSPVLADQGKAGGVLVSFDDITELEEKEVELRRSKDEAEAANRAKSDFLANMSHEIRTPMNSILGFTDALRRGYGKPEQSSEHYLSTILVNGEHLLNLINDILDLSKVEAGHLEVENVSCRPYQIIREVIQVMHVKAEEKGITLEYLPEGSIPESMLSDPARLRQIVTNLVGNAIKFTELGGVTVITRMDNRKNQLVIEVADSGIGMTEQQAATVFDPFVQADSSITRRFGGTGLGLSISKKFAEAMQGEIYATSSEGKGSHFFLKLKVNTEGPVALINAEQINAEADRVIVVDSQQWQFPDARVLVVDDAAENRELINLVLSEQHLIVEEAVDGEDALQKVTDNVYDIILMDVQMPNMDGYTAVKIMRERGIQQPVIALTAHAMKGIEQQCINAGYSGYMSKPINIDKLLQLLIRELGGVEKDDAGPVHPRSAYSDNSGSSTLAFAINEEQPIYSELPTDNPKFAAIVAKFIDRLRQVYSQMQQSAEQQDAETMANHAHWLKGSAGSVGFPQLTELALKLEEFSRAGDFSAIAAQLSDIGAVISRIKLKQEQSCRGSAPVIEDRQEWVIPDQVTSPLALQDERFRAIVEKFVVRLAEQIQAMENALNTDDYDSLAILAHWLKGAGGSVGFVIFTDVAAAFEKAARSENQDDSTALLNVIKDIHSRITL